MCPSSTSSSDGPRDLPVSRAVAGVEDGLIGAPERFGGGAVLLFGVVAIFLATVVGTLAIDSLSPVAAPKLIGTERNLDARARAAASLWDGTWTRLVENDMRIRSRVRRWLVRPYSWFLYTKLSEAKDIVVGKDGWLFLDSRARPPVSEAAVGAACVANQFAALQRLLESHGTQLVALPIPRKSVILEERLPRGVHPVRELEERLIEDLRAHGILTVDLLTAYADEDPMSLFHFGDSHWTVEAELIAAEELSRALGIYLPPEERETELRVTVNEALGIDLFAWIGVDGVATTAPWVQQYRHDMYRVFRKDDDTQVRRHNPKELGRIAIVGTSFTARRSLPVFTRHYSGEHLWNAAKPGEGPMVPLRKFLDARADGDWPEVLVVEFPVHLILSQRGMSSVAPVLGLWAPPAHTTIVGADSWGQVPSGATGGPWTRIASLPKGRLGHSGDGVVSVRLTAAVAPGRCDVQLFCGGIRLDFPWLDGRKQVVLPLMGVSATAEPVLVFMRSDQVARFELAKAEIVAALDPDPVELGKIKVPVTRPDGSWVQRIGFIDGGTVPEMGALELVGGPRWSTGPITLELTFDDDEPPARPMDFESSAPGQHIVVSLSGHAGRRLKAVRLTGEGMPPWRGLIAARLLRPAY
ncbi:MAG: hypothetical protein ACI8QZ_004302 [Chlamydiales bacterium]|jgi:hypothetical protein